MIKHNGFTFTCAMDNGTMTTHPTLTISARTERTAIAKARAKHWDVLRVRAVAGVTHDKIARTVQLVFCPGCAFTVGVRFR